MGDDIGLVEGEEGAVVQKIHDLGIQDLPEHDGGLRSNGSLSVLAVQGKCTSSHDTENGNDHHELYEGKAVSFPHLCPFL